MFRFIDTGANDGPMNMAIDEALLIAQAEYGFPPTIRVYRFIPPTVSIGYFQSMKREIDINSCAKMGYGYVRRPTGGRAVLHDKELTYSVTIGSLHRFLSMSLIDSFFAISEGIVRAIRLLGGEPYYSSGEDLEKFSPSCFAHPTFSDILLNGKKVVGSAQMRNRKGLLQHGSILYRVSIEDIFSCFNMTEDKRRQAIKIGYERISSLSDELGREVTFEEIKAALYKGMEEALGEKLVEQEITSEELKISQFLYKSKYNTDNWNFLR